jgi:hypothetical protein
VRITIGIVLAKVAQTGQALPAELWREFSGKSAGVRGVPFDAGQAGVGGCVMGVDSESR